MKTTVTAAAAIALAVLTAPGAFASRYHVIHHMHNGMHHMRVKMHHGHIHMHNMMYRGHM
jgi:hypothetical protein